MYFYLERPTPRVCICRFEVHCYIILSRKSRSHMRNRHDYLTRVRDDTTVVSVSLIVLVTPFENFFF